MKLLFVIDSLGSGGAQRQMVTLALGLSKRGHQIEFFVYYPQYDHYESMLKEVGISIHKFVKKDKYSLEPLLAIRKLLKSGQYDIVLSFLDTPNLYLEIAHLGKNLPPIVVSERSSYENGHPSRKRILQEQFHHFADAIVTNSNYQAELMRFYHPWIDKKIHVIYNGLDLELFKPRNLRKMAHRFICVGSVVENKNPMTLAESLQVYTALYHVPPPFVDWYGKAYQDDGLVYRKVNDFLKANNLIDYWEWKGEVKDIQLRYPQYIGLIHPAQREGLPNAIAEAMASGLPIIAADICENSRLVSEDMGFLYSPFNDSLSLAKILHQFLNLSEDQRQHMGYLARQRAERLFYIEHYVTEYEKLFAELMDIKK